MHTRASHRTTNTDKIMDDKWGSCGPNVAKGGWQSKHNGECEYECARDKQTQTHARTHTHTEREREREREGVWSYERETMIERDSHSDDTRLSIHSL